MTYCPSSTLGAPQTICTGVSSPISTWQIFNLSASGCDALDITWPTTKFLISFVKSTKSSTSIPVRVIRSAKS